MADKRCLMVVHAHPDDEVFRTAGIYAKYAAAGAHVVAVYATRGEEGEMHDPDLDPEEARVRLGEIREREVRAACAILGVKDVRFLGYRDSGMAGWDTNDNPAAFMNADVDEAAGQLLTIIRETRPQVVVTYDERGDGGYGHPDHIMANSVTVAAFQRARGEPWAPEKLYYTASSRESFRHYVQTLRKYELELPWVREDFNFDEHGLPEAEITARIDISGHVLLKKQALAAHRSQIPADFYYLAMPDEILLEASNVEHYMRICPPPREGEHEDDLFAGIAVRSAVA